MRRADFERGPSGGVQESEANERHRPAVRPETVGLLSGFRPSLVPAAGHSVRRRTQSRFHEPGLMHELRIATGYHGTLAEYAPMILEEGLQPSKNPWEWLGPGVYFWQDAPYRALEWAREWNKRRGRPSAAVCVIKARLRLEDCIDMLDIWWRDILSESSVKFLDLMRSAQTAGIAPRNYRTGRKAGRHELDAAFFTYVGHQLEREGVQVRAVRAAITEGAPILPDSPLCYKSHAQIAIRDLGLIDQVEVVYNENR